MFGKLTESFEKMAVREALKRGTLHCPDCGARSGVLPVRWEDAMECAECGAGASLTEWAAASDPGKTDVRVDSAPDGTLIRREGVDSGGTVWHIPPGGKYGFFLIFSGFWLGITVMLSGEAIFSILTRGISEGEEADWLLIPFFGVFYAVGLGMLYAAIRRKFMKFRLAAGGGEVSLVKEMFGRRTVKKLAAGTVRSVERREFHKQNDKAVYGIEIRGTEGKLRFGTELTDEERAWLVTEVRDAVFGKPEVKEAIQLPGSMTAGKRTRGQIFSVAIPGMTVGTLAGIVVFVAISLVLLTLGLYVTRGEPWLGFRGFWTGLTSVFSLLGLAKVVEFFLTREMERRIEGNAAEISLRTYKRGLVSKDRSFPRESVSGIRASVSGMSGRRTMKRVDLITDKGVVRLMKWMDGDEADAMVEKVRAGL